MDFYDQPTADEPEKKAREVEIKTCSTGRMGTSGSIISGVSHGRNAMTRKSRRTRVSVLPVLARETGHCGEERDPGCRALFDERSYIRKLWQLVR